MGHVSVRRSADTLFKSRELTVEERSPHNDESILGSASHNMDMDMRSTFLEPAVAAKNSERKRVARPPFLDLGRSYEQSHPFSSRSRQVPHARPDANSLAAEYAAVMNAARTVQDSAGSRNLNRSPADSPHKKSGRKPENAHHSEHNSNHKSKHHSKHHSGNNNGRNGKSRHAQNSRKHNSTSKHQAPSKTQNPQSQTQETSSEQVPATSSPTAAAPVETSQSAAAPASGTVATTPLPALVEPTIAPAPTDVTLPPSPTLATTPNSAEVSLASVQSSATAALDSAIAALTSAQAPEASSVTNMGIVNLSAAFGTSTTPLPTSTTPLPTSTPSTVPSSPSNSSAAGASTHVQSHTVSHSHGNPSNSSNKPAGSPSRPHPKVSPSGSASRSPKPNSAASMNPSGSKGASKSHSHMKPTKTPGFFSVTRSHTHSDPRSMSDASHHMPPGTGSTKNPSSTGGPATAVQQSSGAESTTPTPSIIGGVVGGVAGLIVLLLLALYLLRLAKRRKKAAGQESLDDTRSATPATLPGEPQSSFLPGAAAGLLGRLTRSQPPLSTPPPTVPERSFQRVSGRKLPSRFDADWDGPTSKEFGPEDASYPSGTTTYPSGQTLASGSTTAVGATMRGNPFVDPSTSPPRANPATFPSGLGAGTTGDETLSPGPGRTPTLFQNDDFRSSHVARTVQTPPPGSSNSPGYAPPGFAFGFPSRASPTGRGTPPPRSGSRFIEDDV